MVQNVLIALLLASLAVVDARDMHVRRSPSRARLHRRAGGLTYQLAEPGADWNQDLFEPYVRYRARYLAVGCAQQHNTDFFEECCHPRRVGKVDDSDHPAKCSKASPNAPKPEGAAIKAEQKVYAPLVAAGQAGFGGGAIKKTNSSTKVDSSSDDSSNKTTPVDTSNKTSDDASKKAKAAKLAADKAAADAKKQADAEAQQKAAADAAKAKAAADEARKEEEAEAAKKQQEEQAKQQAAADAQKKADEEAAKAKAAADAAKQKQEQQDQQDSGDDSDDGGNSVGGIFSNIVGKIFANGQATWFEQNGGAGACGNVNPEDSKIVALSPALYGDMGQTSPNCGRTVVIENTDNGKTVRAKVADACPPCDAGHLDLSLGAFDALGLRDTGVLPIRWAFSD